MRYPFFNKVRIYSCPLGQGWEIEGDIGLQP